MSVRLCSCEGEGAGFGKMRLGLIFSCLVFFEVVNLYLALDRCRSWNGLWAEYCEMPGADPYTLTDLAWLSGYLRLFDGEQLVEHNTKLDLFSCYGSFLRLLQSFILVRLLCLLVFSWRVF